MRGVRGNIIDGPSIVELVIARTDTDTDGRKGDRSQSVESIVIRTHPDGADADFLIGIEKDHD